MMAIGTIATTLVIPALVSIATLYFYGENIEEFVRGPTLICWTHIQDKTVLCRPKCKKGEFSLPGMEQCMPWLTCKEILADINIVKSLGSGAVKEAYLVKCAGMKMVFNSLLGQYPEDFQHGLNMTKSLQPHPGVVQFLGDCGFSYMTQYYELGTADKIHDILNSEEFKLYNTLTTKFNLCIDYVMILQYLHDSPIGKRVMCDSSDLMKTLQQYLLTDDLHLVVNDLDALPEVNATAGKLVKCGHQELFGDFVAPEQLWPFEGNFSDAEMPGYDEKTDIWKVPNVCNFFLGDESDSQSLKLHLFQIHTQCKNVDSKLRPSAEDLLQEYYHVQKKMSLPGSPKQ